jgi:hypothetical protein
MKTHEAITIFYHTPAIFKAAGNVFASGANKNSPTPPPRFGHSYQYQKLEKRP